MKVILNVLATIGLVLCEVPPPYPPRGFRPSPSFNLPFESRPSQIRQPQTTYGVPNPTPSKLSSSHSPQVQYSAPNTPNVETFRANSFNTPNLAPNFNSKQTIPRTSYGVPITEGSGSFQNKIRIINSQPQTAYSAPNNPNVPNQPQTQYGAPNTRNVETLEQIRKLNLLLQAQNINRNVPATQYLPPGGGSNFAENFGQPTNPNLNLLQSQNSNRNVQQPANQYLPIKEPVNFRNGFQLPQSNAPNLDLQISRQNVLQQLSQQYLPVKDATNFRKGFAFPEPDAFQLNSQNFPPNNNIPNRPETSLQISNQNINFPSTQHQPSRFSGSNLQSSSNSAIPATNYAPSEGGSNFPPIINNPTNFDQQIHEPNFNQQLPVSVDSNTQQFQNVNSNFQQTSTQSNVDIQQVDVRKIQPPSRNINGLQTLPVNVGTNTAQFPNVLQNNFRQSNAQTNVDIQQGHVRKLQPPGSSRVNNVQAPIQNPRQISRPTEPADEAYLPPTTTVRTIRKQLSRPSSTPAPNDEENDEPFPSSDDVAGGPNVAIATAVSGAPGGQSFYLLQPDGRLQRVIYQKNREEGDQENEYTANYYFQNIQPQPNLVYNPLIALGK